MLDACVFGDTATLQHLFKPKNIQKGSEAVYIKEADGPPPTIDLLGAAITSGSLDVVLFLLGICSRISFGARTVTALLDRPDVAILEVLYDYDPTIVQFECDYLRNFATEACMQPPDQIASLLEFLVEHDAPLDVGGLPYQFAIYRAIISNQSLSLIEAMIKKGGPIYHSAMYQAVLRERIDVIKVFMQYRVEGKQENIQSLWDRAEQEGGIELVEIVKAWTNGWDEGQ